MSWVERGSPWMLETMDPTATYSTPAASRVSTTRLSSSCCDIWPAETLPVVGTLSPRGRDTDGEALRGTAASRSPTAQTPLPGAGQESSGAAPGGRGGDWDAVSGSSPPTW